MKDPKSIFVKPETTLLDTLRVIDESARQLALVVDGSSRLLGTVTDGDIRRGILHSVPLEAPVSKVMNPNPIVADLNTPNDELLFIMSKYSIKQIPLVDSSGRIVNLRAISDLVGQGTRKNRAVVMAGGLGKRLGELTKSTPKPLLNVGSKPLLATIVHQLRIHGFSEIYVSVNYRAEMIKEYFTNGPGAADRVKFLEEKEFLGTAGALSLFPTRPEEPFLVMNGDILSTINFAHLLEYHVASKCEMTVCIREFKLQIPYGVVNLKGPGIREILEKPDQTILINAGIYVINPSVLDLIPPETRLDMPTLINQAIVGEKRVGSFPLSEFWLDIGNPTDFRQAQMSYPTKFGDFDE